MARFIPGASGLRTESGERFDLHRGQEDCSCCSSRPCSLALSPTRLATLEQAKILIAQGGSYGCSRDGSENTGLSKVLTSTGNDILDIFDTITVVASLRAEGSEAGSILCATSVIYGLSGQMEISTSKSKSKALMLVPPGTRSAPLGFGKLDWAHDCRAGFPHCLSGHMKHKGVAQLRS